MLRGCLAVTSSFGAESALLLSMVAEIDPSTPVLFLNTLRYRESWSRINPLSNWSRADIEQEIRRCNLPRHPLTGFGFTSIGCAPCTRAVRPEEDPRAGRWAGHVKTECGIHLTPADRSTV
ncbi:MAG: phosphoadenosine phosphosulfate reductase family protein [Acetobacteraceae bacterium]